MTRFLKSISMLSMLSIMCTTSGIQVAHAQQVLSKQRPFCSPWQAWYGDCPKSEYERAIESARNAPPSGGTSGPVTTLAVDPVIEVLEPSGLSNPAFSFFGILGLSAGALLFAALSDDNDTVTSTESTR